MSSFRVRKFLNSATSSGGQTNFTKKKYLPCTSIFLMDFIFVLAVQLPHAYILVIFEKIITSSTAGSRINK